jgi:outer membrane lipoprotein
MTRLLSSAIALLLLGGCATAPKPLQGEFSSLLPEQASASQAASERVRWGGSIVAVAPAANETCIEVLGRDLGDSARPRGSRDVSAGRFLACRAGFYDPAIFAVDREVTVTGEVTSFETRRIGEYDYRYPRVAADVIYLWPERENHPAYAHPAPFWPVYRPLWWGGYYIPYRSMPPRAASGKTEKP